MSVYSKGYALKGFNNAKNRGEKAEFATIYEFPVVGYYPTKNGEKSGDVVLLGGTHIQVKMFDGHFKAKGTLAETIQAEYASHFVVWLKDFSGYYLFTKEEFISELTGRNREEFVREADWNGPRYRLEMGVGKKKWLGKYFRPSTIAIE